MVVESQNVPFDIEAARSEGARKRVLSREWCGDSLLDLVSAVSAIATLPNEAKEEVYQNHLAQALSSCDHLSIAGEVAANSIQVIAEERLQLAKEMADIDASVAREEVEVQRLRKLLQRERRVVDHRKQLEGLASVLLTLPPLPEFSERLATAQTNSTAVDQQIRQLEAEKEVLAKELCLLIHCASSAEESAKRLAGLVEDPTEPPNVDITKSPSTTDEAPENASNTPISQTAPEPPASVADDAMDIS